MPFRLTTMQKGTESIERMKEIPFWYFYLFYKGLDFGVADANANALKRK